MKAIILAAGLGSRLGELTQDKAKSMIEVGNQTMLERMICQLDMHCQIDEIIIVTGYKSHLMEEYVANINIQTKISFIHNKDYATTNNIYSLYLAKNIMENHDVILLESDLIFEDYLLEKIINSEERNLMVVDKFQSWMDGTVIKTDDKKNIIDIVLKKDFNFLEVDEYYKTVNIYRFSQEFSKNIYIPSLRSYINKYGKNEYYESVFIKLLKQSKLPLTPLYVEKEKWYEVDDQLDLDIAQTLFCENKSTKLSLMESRFGGYWRYPNLIDFCYLVNPFYPTKRLIDEIKTNTERLIRDYPSGLKVNNLLVSEYFEIDSENIIVGNGASELIKVMMDHIKGNIGIIVPTFEEYPNRSNHLNIVEYSTNVTDYKYSSLELIEFFKDKDLDYLLLINPDNPSGNYIKKSDVFKLLEWGLEKDINIILDESFIDFVSAELNPSLIDQKIIDKYPNLIIVKSISKSHGVPGVRLGVIVTKNQKLLEILQKEVSIWNINSFGEFYMQIVGKYKKDFRNGIIRFHEVREKFIRDLKTIDYLKVYDSESNFIMCEVLHPYTSREITEILLDEQEVFIKDLSPKKGFERQFIRVAVKNEIENQKLIDALRKVGNLNV